MTSRGVVMTSRDVVMTSRDVVMTSRDVVTTLTTSTPRYFNTLLLYLPIERFRSRHLHGHHAICRPPLYNYITNNLRKRCNRANIFIYRALVMFRVKSTFVNWQGRLIRFLIIFISCPSAMSHRMLLIKWNDMQDHENVLNCLIESWWRGNKLVDMLILPLAK